MYVYQGIKHRATIPYHLWHASSGMDLSISEGCSEKVSPGNLANFKSHDTGSLSMSKSRASGLNVSYMANLENMKKTGIKTA